MCVFKISDAQIHLPSIPKKYYQLEFKFHTILVDKYHGRIKFELK